MNSFIHYAMKLITCLKVVLLQNLQLSPRPKGVLTESNLSFILLISITSVLNARIIAMADVFYVFSSVDTLLSNRGGFCSGTEN